MMFEKIKGIRRGSLFISFLFACFSHKLTIIVQTLEPILS